jgi:hypothetical protein
VVVSYTDDAGLQKRRQEVPAAGPADRRRRAAAVRRAGADFKTFRLGLFGLDKLHRWGTQPGSALYSALREGKVLYG